MKNNTAIFETVLKIVCQELNVSEAEMKSNARNAPLAEARQIFIKVLEERDDVEYTLAELGAVINRHHATVLHSVTTATNLIRNNKWFRAKYQKVKQQLNLYPDLQVINFNFNCIPQY